MEEYAHLGNAGRLARLRGKLQATLATLADAGTIAEAQALLGRWLPAVTPALFADCVAALRQPTLWLHRFRLVRRVRHSAAPVAARFQRAGALRHVANVPPQGQPSRGTVLAWLVGRLRAGWWRLRHGRGSPKQLPGGGAIIAIVGPDASGKSTLVAATAQWLSSVFRVQTAHLGKPPSTWLTLLPNLLLRLLRVATPSLRTSREDTAVSTDDRPRRRGLLYRLRAVMLAWDRARPARRLARQAARLAVGDRSLSVTRGRAPDSARIMDPADDGCTSWLGCWLARLENRLYRQIPAPDIVVRLSAPLNVAVDRNEVREKPGKESAEWVTRRHKQFFLPEFPQARVLELDTNRPRGETVQALRRLVWAALAPPAKASSTPPAYAGGSLVRPMLVEFIGVTGAGKSTLLAATALALTRQGVRVGAADDLILARYGLSFIRGKKLRFALVQMLTLLPFVAYLGTRDGRRLTRLAPGSIAEGMGSVRIGVSLLRNFVKRVGSHVLLERIRRERCGCDIILCDEGIVHAAHNLFVHTAVGPDMEAVVQFGRLVPKPDLLIWVTAPTAQSWSVIRQRGHARVADTPDAAQAFAEHCARRLRGAGRRGRHCGADMYGG